jgi:peptidoglycan hydrolase-like protein with peptidoglycan-binding domain
MPEVELSIDPETGDWPLVQNVGSDEPLKLTLKRPIVKRARLVGMLFDANKCFLLPQALPGIKTIIEIHQEDTKAEVLIVGHAGGDEDLAGADIAFDRAQILGAYLKSRTGLWLNWFGPDKPARSRWGTREIQLMLSALPEGGSPYYKGYASGITDEKTTTAIKSFQEKSSLQPSGKADFDTRKALVEAYMGIADTTLGDDVTPIAHGCEGAFEDTTATASGVVADDRRLEVFFFKSGIAPRPTATISAEGTPEYPKWLSRVIETKDYEFHGIHVQIIDNEKQPAPFANVTLKGPTNGKATADEHGFVSFFGLKAGEYTLSSEKNGYKIGVSKITYPTAKTVTGYAATKQADQSAA